MKLLRLKEDEVIDVEKITSITVTDHYGSSIVINLGSDRKYIDYKDQKQFDDILNVIQCVYNSDVDGVMDLEDVIAGLHSNDMYA